jgi:hypothetical protein
MGFAWKQSKTVPFRRRVPREIFNPPELEELPDLWQSKKQRGKEPKVGGRREENTPKGTLHVFVLLPQLGGGGGSRTRVREGPFWRDYVRSRFVFSAAPWKPASLTLPSLVHLGSELQAEAPSPIPPYDALLPRCGPQDTGGCLTIRQRKQTACWQFWFSDRFTGARNPARLATTIRSRRSRYAPFPTHNLPSFTS